MGHKGSKALRLGFNLGCRLCLTISHEFQHSFGLQDLILSDPPILGVYYLTSGSITRCYLISLFFLSLLKFY
ncbi:hypothetical protein Hdeb2414_s0004g00137951 [Helianthus debilis subsp. tardiflorus]